MEFVVAYLDLDHFKDLNDLHGHETGDRALRLFARVLRDSIRPRDIPARYGGEEFVIVLPNAPSPMPTSSPTASAPTSLPRSASRPSRTSRSASGWPTPTPPSPSTTPSTEPTPRCCEPSRPDATGWSSPAACSRPSPTNRRRRPAWPSRSSRPPRSGSCPTRSRRPPAARPGPAWILGRGPKEDVMVDTGQRTTTPDSRGTPDGVPAGVPGAGFAPTTGRACGTSRPRSESASGSGRGTRPPARTTCAGSPRRSARIRSSCSSSQATTRVPDLVPVRHGRMLESPFAFFRGAARHGQRFGRYADQRLAGRCAATRTWRTSASSRPPERRIVFGLNDFDETLPGPWEWDVKRLAASVEIASRENGFGTRSAGTSCSRTRPLVPPGDARVRPAAQSRGLVREPRRRRMMRRVPRAHRSGGA